jgi:hypothetical protein
VLLTRSRLCPGPKPGSSLHLHVLGTPPAFVLSQDQTLREELLTKSVRNSDRLERSCELCRRARRSVPGPPPGGRGPRLRAGSNERSSGTPGTQAGFRKARRVNLGTVHRTPSRALDDGVEPGHTLGHRQAEVRMLLSFQRPSPPGRRGFLQRMRRDRVRRSGQKSIATSRLGAQSHPTWEASGHSRCLQKGSAPRGGLLCGPLRASSQMIKTRAKRRFPSCRTAPSRSAAAALN